MTTGNTMKFMAARDDRWISPLAGHHFDTTIEVGSREADAITELGVENLRRLKRHDPNAPGWRTIRRLLLPIDTVSAGLNSPPTRHRRRAMLDAAAVLLVRCAETRQSYWGWTSDEWTHVLGRTQTEFHAHAPGWAHDEVRPYLATHAYLLGSFTEFHRLGSFQRLTLSRSIFGKERVNSEIGRLRTVLLQWGYKLGRDDDSWLPMVTCQLFLANRSPHLEELNTDR